MKKSLTKRLLYYAAAPVLIAFGWALERLTDPWRRVAQHTPGAQPAPSPFFHYEPLYESVFDIASDPNTPEQPDRYGRDMQPHEKPVLMQHGKRGTLATAGPTALEGVEDIGRIGFRFDGYGPYGPERSLWVPSYTRPGITDVNQEPGLLSRN